MISRLVLLEEYKDRAMEDIDNQKKQIIRNAPSVNSIDIQGLNISVEKEKEGIDKSIDMGIQFEKMSYNKKEGEKDN